MASTFSPDGAAELGWCPKSAPLVPPCAGQISQACKAKGSSHCQSTAALVYEIFKPAHIDYFSHVSYTLCRSFFFIRVQVVRCTRGNCVSTVGLSPENGCLLQSFLCRNLFMSFPLCPHFPLYCSVSARAGWRSVHKLIVHVEKSFSFFFFLSNAYTTSFFTEECWVFLFSLQISKTLV